jgi:hypothetical protein
MRYAYAIRKLVKSGEESRVEFGEIDAKTMGLHGDFMGGSYSRETALLIVNKWNYVATLQTRVEYLYFLPCEGANETDLKKDPFYRAGGGPA